jgi:hypothetical protein
MSASLFQTSLVIDEGRNKEQEGEEYSVIISFQPHTDETLQQEEEEEEGDDQENINQDEEPASAVGKKRRGRKKKQVMI